MSHRRDHVQHDAKHISSLGNLSPKELSVESKMIAESRTQEIECYIHSPPKGKLVIIITVAKLGLFFFPEVVFFSLRGICIVKINLQLFSDPNL